MAAQNGLNTAVHAHHRIRRPRSPWSLLLALLSLLGTGVAWIGFVYLALVYRRAMVPADAFLFNGTRLGNILAFVAPGFPSMAIGLLVGNFLLWWIPPARADLGAGSSGRRSAVFRSSQRALAKFGAGLLAVALILCFLGANNFWALTAGSILYRPMVSSAARHYAWSSVEEIATGCSAGKSTSYNFVLRLKDKTRIDLMKEAPHEFASAYPRIQLALKEERYGFSTRGLVGTCVARAPRAWLEMLTRRPSE